jgi:hypothetical protein
MIFVEWVPRDGKPTDAEDWQRVIEDAYGTPPAGRVQLVRTTQGWRVVHASKPIERQEQSTVRLWEDMAEEVKSALKKAGRPVSD